MIMPGDVDDNNDQQEEAGGSYFDFEECTVAKSCEKALPWYYKTVNLQLFELLLYKRQENKILY